MRRAAQGHRLAASGKRQGRACPPRVLPQQRRDAGSVGQPLRDRGGGGRADGGEDLPRQHGQRGKGFGQQVSPQPLGQDGQFSGAKGRSAHILGQQKPQPAGGSHLGPEVAVQVAPVGTAAAQAGGTVDAGRQRLDRLAQHRKRLIRVIQDDLGHVLVLPFRPFAGRKPFHRPPAAPLRGTLDGLPVPPCPPCGGQPLGPAAPPQAGSW